MTATEDVLCAVSLTRVHEWGVEVAVLGYLAARQCPTSSGATSVQQVSLRELARRTGIDRRAATKALRRLERRGVIACDPGRGVETSTYFVRDPRRWHGAPWRVDRVDVATTLDALFGRQTHHWDLGRGVSIDTPLARSPRAIRGKPTWAVASPLTRHSRGPSGVSIDTPPPRGASFYREREREESLSLSDEARELIDAFTEGSGAEAVWGRPRQALVKLAASANGNLPGLVRLARDHSTGRNFEERLAKLEKAAAAAAPPVVVRCHRCNGTGESEVPGWGDHCSLCQGTGTVKAGTK